MNMFRKKIVVTLIAGVASMALPAFSQSETPDNNEVSVQAFGSFVKTTTDDAIENKATNTGGVLGSYRYFFNAHSGVEADYGYSLNTQSYGSSAGVLGVKSYSHEVSAAYVFRLPMRNFTPFVLAGAGGLIFDPKDFVGASAQARAAFVYGGGADFKLSQHVFVRAEYRGLVYDSPTYDLTGLAGADRITHRAEPSLGFGYGW
jgi:opacity protein-like surface antigen